MSTPTSFLVLSDLLDHQALVLTPDGRTFRVDCAHGPNFAFKELQDAVEGYVALMPMPGVGPDYVMLVNEEGLPRGLADNPTASAIARQRVVGIAVILRTATFKRAE